MNYSVSEQDDIIIISLTGKIMGGPEATEINEKFNQLIDEKSEVVVKDSQMALINKQSDFKLSFSKKILKPKKWTAETPNLYTLAIAETAVDSLHL